MTSRAETLSIPRERPWCEGSGWASREMVKPRILKPGRDRDGTRCNDMRELPRMMAVRLPRVSRPRIRRGIAILLAVLASWLLVSSAVAYRLTRRLQARSDEPFPSLAWGHLESYRIATRD